MFHEWRNRSESPSMQFFFLYLINIVSTQDSIPLDSIQSLLATLPDLFSDNSTSLLNENTTLLPTSTIPSGFFSDLPDQIPDNSTTSLLIEDTTISSTPTVSSDIISDLPNLLPTNSTPTPINEKTVPPRVPFDLFADLKINNLYSNSTDFDFIEYHIRRYLNHRFSPCTDFFRFTCDFEDIGNNSLSDLSEDFYRKILLSSQPLDDTQIDNDLRNLQESSSNSTDFSSLEYSMALTERCASNQSCFADEFKLTYQVYNFLQLNSTLLLQGFNESLVDLSPPDKLEHLTTQLHQAIDSVTNLRTALQFYEGARARVRVMQKLKERKESLGLILAKTRELAIEMAQGLFEKFNRTPWLHVKNIFNLPTFVQFSTILQNMTLRTDLDEGFDFNSTAQTMLIDQYLSYYNYSSDNDLGSSLYTTKFSLLYATSQLSSQLRREGRSELLFRLSHSLQFVSGNVQEGIVLNAPTFFPLAINSRPESLLGSLGTSIARELVYRFVNPKYTRRSEEYALEYEGITEHFIASCEIFGEKSVDCSRIRSQMQEYISDLEGINLAYELMRRSMDYDDLHKQPYSDLPFTSEQLFFIAHSISHCRDSQQLNTQKVNAVVRVNGALSQMPELAQAFGCANSDPMTTK